MSTVREQAAELLRLLGLDTSIVALDVVDALAEAHLLRSEDTSEDTSTDVHTPVSTPRVWRSGDPEPGGAVVVVLDRDGDVWQRSRYQPGGWVLHEHDAQEWPGLSGVYGPLVEVTLPEPVAE
jgi:hypothetical protein